MLVATGSVPSGDGQAEDDANGDQAAKRARVEDGQQAGAAGPAGPQASGAAGEAAAAGAAEGAAPDADAGVQPQRRAP